LGKNGKGACEHFDIDRSEVEISIGSYGSSLASLGGFTVSTKELCAHQRLSSHAYIFSASPPPYLAVAASKSIEIVANDGAERIKKLRANTKIAREAIKDIKGLEVLGDTAKNTVGLSEQGVRLGDNLQEGELPFFYICDT
jgi:serine palmitoyltransferase